MVALAGVTVIETRTAVVTVNVVLPDTLPDVALIEVKSNRAPSPGRARAARSVHLPTELQETHSHLG